MNGFARMSAVPSGVGCFVKGRAVSCPYKPSSLGKQLSNPWKKHHNIPL